MQLDYVLELPNDLRAIERSVDYLTEKGRRSASTATASASISGSA
jgi:hypothetical protein